MQPVASTTKDGVTIVAPAGVIDTRTAQAFEATMVQAFGGGARAFAVDFSQVQLITSAGIRVLVMMAHRLRGSGGLVLFALGDRVRTVFEIGGLLQQFRIVEGEAQAFELLSKPAPVKAPDAPRSSKLAALVLDVVCSDATPPGVPRPEQAPSAPTSALATAVTDALGRWSPPPAGAPSS
jgi:anti-anti-sigma factor